MKKPYIEFHENVKLDVTVTTMGIDTPLFTHYDVITHILKQILTAVLRFLAI
jgi:hypothetical protein